MVVATGRLQGAAAMPTRPWRHWRVHPLTVRLTPGAELAGPGAPGPGAAFPWRHRRHTGSRRRVPAAVNAEPLRSAEIPHAWRRWSFRGARNTRVNRRFACHGTRPARPRLSVPGLDVVLGG